MKKSFILLIGLLILFACDDQRKKVSENKTETIKTITSNKPKLTYDKRDKIGNNFLFLDFWEGMSPEDFKIISDSLLETEKLKLDKKEMLEFRIDVGTEKIFDHIQTKSAFLNVRPIYKDNELVRIDLFKNRDPETIYVQFLHFEYLDDLFTKKYGSSQMEKSDPIRYSKFFHLDLEKTYPESDYSFYREKVTRIWLLQEKAITMTEKYELKSTNNKYFPQIEWFVISYSGIDYFKSNKEKERQQKQNKKLELDKKLKESFDDI